METTINLNNMHPAAQASLNANLDAALANPGFAAFKAQDAISFIRPYDPKAPAIEGYTHHAITYRSTNGKATAPAKMVTLPSVVLPSDWVMSADAATILIRAIEKWQKDQVKGAIEDKQSIINWSGLTLSNALTSLTSITQGDYLTKESILDWVSSALGDAISLRASQLSDAKGHNDAERLAQAARTTNWYRDNLSKLASKVPSLPMEICEKLQAFLAPFGDSMAVRLQRILTKWLNPAVADIGEDA